MIVVDTDVLAYAVIRRDKARTELVDKVDRVDPIWAAPTLWQAEFRNVLASYMRFRRMTVDEAASLSMIARSHVRDADSPPDIDVLRLVAKSNCSAYDCEFVALANALGTKLVTGDRKLAAAFPETAITMEGFVGD